jgi:hypothetical protein
MAEMIAGEPIRGSWWGHPAGHAIFAALNSLAESPDVVRTRLLNGKVTLVHRRLWPALVRVADQLPPDGLAAIREEHTASGVLECGRNRFRVGSPPTCCGLRRNSRWTRPSPLSPTAFVDPSEAGAGVDGRAHPPDVTDSDVLAR